jgi:hypothetical protein
VNRGGESHWLLAAVLLGVLLRTVHVVQHDFPLNDGGLFAAMAEDVRAAGFRLPWFTTYNDERIPFGYSPVGFYLVAGLAELTGVGTIELLRWVPLVGSLLTVPAFVLLAQRLLGGGATLVAAVLAFALVPRSFVWLLMGGGLTRSLGFLFVILGLHQGLLLFAGGRSRHVAGVAACAALVALTHLGTLPFFAFSYGLLLLAYGRNRRAVLGSAAAALAAVLLASPWWLMVVLRHGWDPFLAAQATGGSAFADPVARARVLNALARFGLGTTGEPLFPVVLVLAIVGGISQLPSRQLLLPLWWVLTLLVDQRAGPTYAALPVAMLAGIGAGRVLLPALRHPGLQHAGAAAAVIYSAAAALITDPDRGGEGHLLEPLPRPQRAAVTWVAEHAARDAEFLIVPERGWSADRLSEWFPALARRRSVATVQGSEWLAGAEFRRRRIQSESLRACGRAETGCIERWRARTGRQFTHLLIPRDPNAPCCTRLLEALAADSGWALRYDGAGAVIFERTGIRSAETRGRGALPRSSAARPGAPAPG